MFGIKLVGFCNISLETGLFRIKYSKLRRLAEISQVLPILRVAMVTKTQMQRMHGLLKIKIESQKLVFCVLVLHNPTYLLTHLHKL